MLLSADAAHSHRRANRDKIGQVERAQRGAVSDRESARGSLRRALRLLALTLAGLVALVVSALVVAMIAGRIRSAAALDRLRASGAPVYPADLRVAPSPIAASYDAWVQRGRDVEEPFGAFEEGRLPECADSVAVLVNASFADLALREDLQFATEDPLRAGRLTDCQRAVHRAWLAESSSTLAWATSLESSARPDWRMLLSSDLTPVELLTRAGAGSTQRAAEALSVAMLNEAWSGNSDEAVRLCARVFELADVYREAPNMLAFEMLGLQESMALSALQALVLALPSEVDLQRIEAQLDAVGAIERFRFALEGQRAQTNACFRDIADGLSPFPVETWTERLDALAVRIAADWLLSSELGRFEQQFALLGRGYAQTKPLLERMDAKRDAWLPHSPTRSSAAHDALFLAQLETNRLLCQALLIAYRDGLDAASAWARQQPDPFGTETLRVRVDADGVLTVWSVGANGSDDSAPLPPWAIEDWGIHLPPDRAIRFRPRRDR